MTKEQIEGALQKLAEYQGQLPGSREAARKAYLSSETKEVNLLRGDIDMLIALLVTTVNKPIARVDESGEYQISVSASYIRSHFLINDLIMNGDLQEGAILIRKQIESVARLNELDVKPLDRLLTKTPNLKACFKNGEGRIYSSLSEAAHFGDSRIAELLTVSEDPSRGVAVVSVYPTYNAHAHTCFQMQLVAALYFYGWMVAKLHDWYPNESFTFELEIYALTLSSADKAGIIQLPPHLAYLKVTSSE